MLILVRMLMRCLRKSGFDGRHMAEAALAMRNVMSREEEPSFVIKDPIYVKESTNTTSLLQHARRWSKDGDIIRVVEITDLVFT